MSLRKGKTSCTVVDDGYNNYNLCFRTEYRDEHGFLDHVKTVEKEAKPVEKAILKEIEKLKKESTYASERFSSRVQMLQFRVNDELKKSQKSIKYLKGIVTFAIFLSFFAAVAVVVF